MSHIKKRGTILDRMYSSIFTTSTVIAFSRVGASFIDGIITTCFLGPLAMAAVGLSSPYFTISALLSGCLSFGMQTMCTNEIGRGHIAGMNRIFGEAASLAAFVSVAVTVAMIIALKQFAIFLGASGNAAELLNDTSTYIKGLAVGLPALVMCEIISPAIQLDNGSHLVRNGAIMGVVTDLFADIAAVVLDMGIWGIGLASALSAYVNLAVLLLYFRRKERVLKVQWRKIDWKDILEMVRLGQEKFVSRVVNIIRPVLLNTMVIAAGGSLAMSVMSIRNSISNLSEIPGYGISGGVAMLCGLFYGEKNEDDILNTGRIAHRYTLEKMTVIAAILAVIARPIARFYVGDEEEMLPLLVFSIYMVALRLPLATLTYSRVCYLQAIHRIKLAQLLSFILNFAYVILLTYILNKAFGVYGIMAAFPGAELLTMISVYLPFLIKHDTKTPMAVRQLRLDPSFHLGPGDVINLTVMNQEEASLLSEQICLFCKGHKFDSRRSYYAGLCAEEMTANIIEYGFRKKARNNVIDVRVVISEGDLIIRIRDRCAPFDISKRAVLIEKSNEADPCSNIGIRLIYKTAKEVQYYHTLDTNNTIIRI